MTPAPANRSELLHVFAQVAQGFNEVQRQVEEREARLKQTLDALERIRTTSPWSRSGLAPDHPFLTFAKACQNNLDERFDAWIKNVRNYERNTQFRSKFGDSLLVFVFGKVKAGKSSLGNYLAYGRTEPDAQLIAQAQPKPEFFSETSTRLCEQTSDAQIRENGCFGVDVVEATSAIQGFRLPGLTWVDSPGLHSVNAGNGELTKDYVDAADLVIFLSKSESPGRRSDLDEARALLHRDKNMIVLLTGSDENDVDVDDDGEVVEKLIMKGDSARQLQVDYFIQSLRESAPECSLDDLKVHSISSCYAEQGPAEEQQERWQVSGLADFAAEIGRLAVAEGLQIKQQVPLKNLQAFCRQLSESISLQQTLLSELQSELTNARKELKNNTERVLSQLQQRLPMEINKLADQHVLDDQGFSDACWALFDRQFAECAGALCEAIGQKFEDLGHAAQSVAPAGKALPGFTPRTRSVNYQSRRNEGIGKAGGAGLGGWGGAEAGAALGTMLLPGPGTIIGGLIGAAIGGWMGAKAGAAAGGQFDETTQFEIIVGDNRDEVSLTTREHFIEYAKDRLNRLYLQLDALCFVDVSTWLSNLSQALKNLDDLAAQQINAISKELDHGPA
ncbi:dynamin family protein [Pseudomonas protegens]|jgi:predicted GTPase|uniref:dynamin family protein n=1 Tax=Pseudomonas protegens TaxID=380021 RepID=UPI003EBF100E